MVEDTSISAVEIPILILAQPDREGEKPSDRSDRLYAEYNKLASAEDDYVKRGVPWAVKLSDGTIWDGYYCDGRDEHGMGVAGRKRWGVREHELYGDDIRAYRKKLIAGGQLKPAAVKAMAGAGQSWVKFCNDYAKIVRADIGGRSNG